MEIKIELQLKLWKESEKSLDELAKKKKLTIILRTKDEEGGKFNSWYNEVLIRNLYMKSNNTNYKKLS